MQKTKKNHSRKQLIEWIAQESNSKDKNIASFNHNSLKNGVFFLTILQKIFPSQSETIKVKMKQKPITDYDFQKNLLLIKKILQKYEFQVSFEINQILKNKGCFEFLNFLKNLNDSQTINLLSDQNQIIQQTISSPDKNLLLLTKSKIRQGSSTKIGQKPFSQTKFSRNYSEQKTQNPLLKSKSGKNLVEVGKKGLINNDSNSILKKIQIKNSSYMSEFDSVEDCNQALYELALRQSIESFKSILRKLKIKAEEVIQNQLPEQYLNKINSAIFSRN